MKNIVRLSIVALALVGFSASAVVSSAASSKHTMVAAGGGGGTVALCSPGGKDGCGID